MAGGVDDAGGEGRYDLVVPNIDVKGPPSPFLG